MNCTKGTARICSLHWMQSSLSSSSTERWVSVSFSIMTHNVVWWFLLTSRKIQLNRLSYRYYHKTPTSSPSFSVHDYLLSATNELSNQTCQFSETNPFKLMFEPWCLQFTRHRLSVYNIHLICIFRFDSSFQFWNLQFTFSLKLSKNLPNPLNMIYEISWQTANR